MKPMKIEMYAAPPIASAARSSAEWRATITVSTVLNASTAIWPTYSGQASAAMRRAFSNKVVPLTGRTFSAGPASGRAEV